MEAFEDEESVMVTYAISVRPLCMCRGRPGLAGRICPSATPSSPHPRQNSSTLLDDVGEQIGAFSDTEARDIVLRLLARLKGCHDMGVALGAVQVCPSSPPSPNPLSHTRCATRPKSCPQPDPRFLLFGFGFGSWPRC